MADYTIGITTNSRLLTVQLEGELDADAMPELRATLASVGRATPPVLSFDFTRASYVGLSAIGALLVARARAQHAQVGVITPGAPRPFYRLMAAADRAGTFRPPAEPAYWRAPT